MCRAVYFYDGPILVNCAGKLNGEPNRKKYRFLHNVAFKAENGEKCKWLGFCKVKDNVFHYILNKFPFDTFAGALLHRGLSTTKDNCDCLEKHKPECFFPCSRMTVCGATPFSMRGGERSSYARLIFC